MSDIFHIFGCDIQVDATGDILTTDGVEETQQRLYRRLLTNPGDYIWNVAYGAGLPQFVGQPVQENQITAITIANMYRETGVLQNPPPTVQIDSQNDGVVILEVGYTDANTNKKYGLTLPLGEN